MKKSTCFLSILFIFVSILIPLANLYVFADDVTSYVEIQFDNVAKQSSEFTCGVAVLSTLFSYYYDTRITEKEMINAHLEKVIEEERGITLLDMKEIVESRGFQGYGYKANYSGLLDLLQDIPVPVIAHTQIYRKGTGKIGHFSLILGVYKDHIIVKDTTFGNIIYTPEQFLKKWTGYLFLVLPPGGDQSLTELSAQRLKEDLEESQQYIERMIYYENIFHF